MSRLFKVYHKYLTKYPFTVQVCQTATLVGVGDVIAQFAVEKRTLKTYSPKRSLKFVLLGGVLIGPTVVVWYRTLAWKFGTVGSPSVAVKKMLCDQGFFAPSFIPVIFTSIALLEGKTVEEIKVDLKNKYFDILMANYTIWPLTGLVNFCLVPLNYQVMLVNCVALIWNTYMSWKTHVVPQDEL